MTTMKVRELIKWLEAFPNQDAEVRVVEHSAGTGYYDQGGTVRSVPFDPEKHADYFDFAQKLLLGEINLPLSHREELTQTLTS